MIVVITHTYTGTHTCTCTHTCTGTHTCTCTHTCTGTHTCTCTYTCTCRHVHVRHRKTFRLWQLLTTPIISLNFFQELLVNLH